MTAAIFSLVQLRTFPTGTRAFTMAKVANAADGMGRADIRARADACRTQALETLGRERDWRKGRKKAKKSKSNAFMLDPGVDRALAAIESSTKELRGILAPDDPITAKADDFLATYFPDGVGAVTSLAYEDEASAIGELLAEWATPEGKETIGTLELEARVARLAELLPPYVAEIAKDAPKTTTWADVRAARTAGQKLLLETVIAILAVGVVENQGEVCDALLAPILAQDTRIGEANARRQSAEVDPDSGEPVVVVEAEA